jgi:hypothetical protein
MKRRRWWIGSIGVIVLIALVQVLAVELPLVLSMALTIFGVVSIILLLFLLVNVMLKDYGI